MTGQIQSTQHSHGVVVHQRINAHQRETLLNSLRDQHQLAQLHLDLDLPEQASRLGPGCA